MANDATVIVGHLDDNELMKSINKMVQDINTATSQMTSTFNSAISKMEAAAKRFGDNQGEMTARTKRESRERVATLDKEAQALQEATKPKSARESYYAFVQGYKEQANQIAQTIRSAQDALDTAINNRVNELTTRLERAKAKLTELYTQLTAERMKAEESGNWSTKPNAGILRTQQAIEYTKKHIAEINRMIAEAPNAFQAQAAKIEQMREKRERVLNIMRDEVQVQREENTQASEEVAVVNNTTEAVTRRLEVERAVTQEVSKRKKYQAPEMWTGYEVTPQALAGFMKSHLGDNERVINWNEQTSSINHLNAALRQYQNVYSSLLAEERNSPYGKTIIQQMQVLETNIRRLRNEMQRPLGFDVIQNMPTRTLDDLNEKLKALASYRSGLDFTKQANELKQVNVEYENTRKKMDEIMGKNKELANSNNFLARSFNYIKNRIAFYLTVGASTALVKELIEVRSQYEMTERALGILVDSAERGTQIFKELSEMALVSPYTLIELSNAAKQLTAYDVAAKDVVETTRRLADMTAAVGVPLERLTYALGQIKAYGYLNARDARMFANAGIPLVKELADYYTDLEGRLVSVGDVYDRIKKKAIGYNDVMSVVNKMTDEGGKFFDYQVKVADTLKVQLANLTLAWNNMLNDIGASQQGFISSTIGGLKQALLHWREFNRALKAVAATLGLVAVAQVVVVKNSQSVSAAWVTQAAIGRKLTTVFGGLNKSMATLAANPWTWVAVVIAGLIDLAMFVNNTREEIGRMNDEIRKGAQESAEAFSKMRSSREIKEFYDLASGGKLDRSGGEKAWEAIREQIELSAASSEILINDLLKIDDINERIVKGFNYAEKIEEANRAMADFGGVDLSKDTWLWGMFGEGIAEDFEDYVETMRSLAETEKNLGREGLVEWQSQHHSTFEEMKKEAAKLADDIVGKLQIALGEGIGDPVKVNEAVNRVLKQIKLSEPKLQGEVGKVFDVQMGYLIGERLPEVYKANQNLWSQFTEELKKSRSEFSNISDDILDVNNKFTEGQIDAINKAKENMKTLHPAFAEEIDKMLAGLDSRDFRITIAAVFDVKQLTDLQKDFNEKFITGRGKIAQTQYGIYNQKEGETTLQWEKRLKDNEKEQLDIIAQQDQIMQSITDHESTRYKTAEKSRQAAMDELKVVREVQDYEGFGRYTKKDKGGTKKDILGEAFQKEVEIITNIQKRYKDYRKEGVNAQEAIKKATEEYGRTLVRTNTTLNKYGVKTKTSDELANMDLRSVREYYKSLLDMATNLGNAKGVEALEKAIASLNVEITNIDYKKITDGLNNELSKLKEEYDLGVELDASPELGDAFASIFDIDPTNLPKNVDEYAALVVDAINRAIKKRGSEFELPTLNLTNDDLKSLKEMAEAEGGTLDLASFEAIQKAVLEIRSMRKKEVSEQQKEWNELLEKYGEYQSKKLRIEEQYQAKLAAARKRGASADVIAAIENQRRDELSQTALKEFQKSPIWATATGSLQGLTSGALSALADELERYKRSERGLRPKQLEQINKALVNIRKEMNKKNPFLAIANAMDEASARTADFDQAIEELIVKAQTLENLSKEKNNGVVSKEDQKQIDEYNAEMKKLLAMREKLTQVSADSIIEGINGMRNAVNGVTGSLQEMLKEMAKTGNSKSLTRTVDFFENMQENINAANAGFEAGGGWGAAIAGVIDLVPRIIMAANRWSNQDIDEKITDSEVAVKKLEIAYENLEVAIDEAYGTGKYAAQQMAIENKKLQLQQLQTQLKLEESRKEKNQDANRIADLKSQINSLQNEIKKAAKEITNDLLGITSVGDAAEEMVSSMIEAFKKGEDYMSIFDESFEKMVDNMIMKSIVSKVIGDRLQQVWDTIDKKVNERAEPQRQVASDLQKEIEKYDRANLEQQKERYESILQNMPQGNMSQGWRSLLDGVNKKLADLDSLEAQYAQAMSEYEKALAVTPQDVQGITAMAQNMRSGVEADLQAWLAAFGIEFGQDSTKELSALQQGIKGVSEETASAIEAYMNGVSQQVYLHSDLLTQIRDSIMSFDFDVANGTRAQMLLQLQQSYQVQQSIESILQGVLNPSGRAFNVELQ